MARRTRLIVVGVTAFLAVMAIGVWAGWGALSAWRSVEKVPFDPTAAREALPVSSSDDPAEIAAANEASPTATAAGAGSGKTPTTAPPLENDPEAATSESDQTDAGPGTAEAPASGQSELDVYLVIGSDTRAKKESNRADTIMLFITPPDRSRSLLLSIPRLLYVPSPCTGDLAAINTNLDGCGEVAGPELLAVAVEDYTGLSIDHLIMFDFEGFERAVNRLDGVEVCVERPVKLRPTARKPFLEEGCTTVNGQQALRWVRSRRTLELVDDEWQLMEGVSDATRTDRQRDIVRQLLTKVGSQASDGEFSALVNALSGSFVLDDDLGLNEAISMASDLRKLADRPLDDARVAATSTITENGEYVLIPDQPFAVYLEPVL